MDFIDWCHHVLNILEREKFNQFNLDDHRIPSVIFPKEITQQHGFHESNARMGMFDTLELLSNVDLVEKDTRNWKITPFGRKILADPIDYWTEICSEELDSEEETLIKLVNKRSPQVEDNPTYGWLKSVEADQIFENFEISPPPAKTNEEEDILQKYIYDLPQLLKERNFLTVSEKNGFNTGLKPTYQGLVWDIKRGFTVESKLIDELVKDWETTNVDFKREVHLDTKKQKAEFAKNILGLATTKSSGRRYMIIGFDDKTRECFAPPDPNITQEIMEQHLANLTNPIVNIRYEIIDYQKTKVGKLEVIREPEKLPYKAKKDVIIDATSKKNLEGRKGLEKDKVYVRHGSHTESPSEIEMERLEEEGKHARGEI